MWAGMTIGGVVVGVGTALLPLWAPTFVSGLFGKIFMTLAILGGAALSGVGVYLTVADSTNKRETIPYQHGQYITSLHNGDRLHYYDIVKGRGEAYHSLLSSYNDFEYMAFTINGTSERGHGGMIARSKLGNHAMRTFSSGTFGRMLDRILMQHNASCVGDCAIEKGMVVTNLNDSKIAKRTSYFEVDWASYNFYEANTNDAYETLENPDVSYTSLEDELNESYSNLDNPDTWKYCYCTNLSPDGNYNDITEGVGIEGEVYFNTYGGVDSYCLNAHCGAQCSTVGCV